MSNTDPDAWRRVAADSVYRNPQDYRPTLSEVHELIHDHVKEVEAWVRGTDQDSIAIRSREPSHRDRCTCGRGSVGNRTYTDPACVAHGVAAGHAHEWDTCDTCEDGSMVCRTCPAPAPHLNGDGTLYISRPVSR